MEYFLILVAAFIVGAILGFFLFNRKHSVRTMIIDDDSTYGAGECVGMEGFVRQQNEVAR